MAGTCQGPVRYLCHGTGKKESSMARFEGFTLHTPPEGLLALHPPFLHILLYQQIPLLPVTKLPEGGSSSWVTEVGPHLGSCEPSSPLLTLPNSADLVSQTFQLVPNTAQTSQRNRQLKALLPSQGLEKSLLHANRRSTR